MLGVLDAHDDRAFLLGLGAVEIGDAIDEREDMAVTPSEALPAGKIFECLALRIGTAKTIGLMESGDARSAELDRKSTRLTPVTNAQLVCRLLLEKKKNN